MEEEIQARAGHNLRSLGKGRGSQALCRRPRPCVSEVSRQFLGKRQTGGRLSQPPPGQARPGQARPRHATWTEQGRRGGEWSGEEIRGESWLRCSEAPGHGPAGPASSPQSRCPWPPEKAFQPFHLASPFHPGRCHGPSSRPRLLGGDGAPGRPRGGLAPSRYQRPGLPGWQPPSTSHPGCFVGSSPAGGRRGGQVPGQGWRQAPLGGVSPPRNQPSGGET